MMGLRSTRETTVAPEITSWVPSQALGPGGTGWNGADQVPSSEHVLRSALLRFVAFSAIAFVIVSAFTVWWSGHVAESEALRRAQATGKGVASGVIAPFVTPGVFKQNPADLAELDRVAKSRMADGSIYRIKVWTQDERVVYSDEAPLIGEHFPIEQEDKELFGTTNASADLSDLRRPENRYEADQGKLVEVYVGFKSPDGVPLLFEAYLPFGQVQSTADVLERQLLPLSLGSLGLLLVLLLPLSVSLARRTERAQRERNRMLSTSIAASDVERRRIARDLHDGVVQDLAGLGYALTAIADGLPAETTCDAARQGTRKAIGILRRDVDALRTLVTDIYPPELEEGQLVRAMAAMLRTVGPDGPRTSLVAPDSLDVDLGRDTCVLLYRVVREAVRNAVKHAHATAIQVTLRVEDDSIAVEVADDGVGFADTVRDAGGDLTIDSSPGAGVRLRVSLPIA